jgi:hypothetical protein
VVSIRNWYANESARDHGGSGYDWENDDPIDRTPDSWLDDAISYAPARGAAVTSLRVPAAPMRRRAPASEDGTLVRAVSRSETPCRASASKGFYAVCGATVGRT